MVAQVSAAIHDPPMSNPAISDGNGPKSATLTSQTPPNLTVSSADPCQTPSPPTADDANAMWKVIGSPARRASVVDGTQDVLAAMAARASDLPSGRAIRDRAQTTPNHQHNGIESDLDAPPGFGPVPHGHHNGGAVGGSPFGKGDNTRSLTNSPSSKASWAGVSKQWGNAPNQSAIVASIWNNSTPASTIASLSAEKAFLESDLPSRHYRSLSFVVNAEQSSQQFAAGEAFRTRLGEMPLPSSLETSELTEEEYAAMPKSRSRSKSSSAIYRTHPNDGSASMMPNHEQIPDMSSIWRQSETDYSHDLMAHRRSSTQPNHQMFMWEAMRSSNLATANDMNGINTEELLERYRQQQAAQIRRFSVAPSVVNRFITNHIDAADVSGSGSDFDIGRRRHSLGGSALDQNRKANMRSLKDGINTLAISDQIEEIDDYFENTENRVRAWAEAGKNLQMNHAPESPVSAVSPVPRQMFKFPLYVVEFKAGRVDYFYTTDSSVGAISVGDLAIVEADRGKDLGKVIDTGINSFQDLQLYQATHPDALVDSHMSNKEVYPKRIFRLAQGQEIGMLLSKGQDEAKAMNVCQVKIRQRKLAMEIVDAEYQWDRRKLTFYFVAERRVDFRELVRELFKIFKMRIWMCAVNPMRQE
ncbi:hypothetical protein QVD99_001499 [Batrachochytrium dendrobatidis]|nr:hypothetical protein O5D80_005964 [Batrachochytrium dendrobatidis]OAJ36350.1 hypothetical protein BDEG_20532 [Batrachochytrium dendrobatidis JEL423]KAJ8325770.1 hypothetical protein O5D80_005964 [Batrachochytrium dendrobatidis]KAK5671658.1 hypothetical protein QVD99_001499 [Batrachochytrium dendrobatidis]KAK5671659.1 hypothetical protein QVD99_001499 [Batrachochytrium dendrobatidis]